MLESRAVGFALAAGATVFVAALLVSYGLGRPLGLWPALAVAAASVPTLWFLARRTLRSLHAAVNAATERLAQAAQGDLDSQLPHDLALNAPELARGMAGLFQQLNANLEGVQRLAMFDPVTGLPNRTHFRRSCERMLAAMPADASAALLFIDLDRFKAVNDRLGHAMGDMLLGLVANRLRSVSERTSIELGIAPALIGRLAGDEFTLFFSDLPSAADARRIGDTVLATLNEPFHLNGQDADIGASIGIALSPQHGVTLTDLMRSADTAMYQAKGLGRGRVEIYSDMLAGQLAERAKLESELRRAIGEREFALVYQPQVAVTNGRVVAAEALLRWRHPQSGLRLPASFLAVAEESGMIVEIGDWVIDSVAQSLAGWARAGIDKRLAINISPRQLDYVDFFQRLRQAMLDRGAPARLLELELTETLATKCSDDVTAAIARLRSDGATIAIDDFGSGYSNLTRLRGLPVDRIKLDRSLVATVATNAETRAIVHAVIGLIHGLGCEAVAKGIETTAQIDVLRVIGCDVIQGYAVAPPMSEADFVAWMRGPGAHALAG